MKYTGDDYYKRQRRVVIASFVAAVILLLLTALVIMVELPGWVFGLVCVGYSMEAIWVVYFTNKYPDEDGYV